MTRTGKVSKRAGLVGALILLALLACAVLVGCLSPRRGTAPTFATLRKVDDYPLYTMTYDGRYDLPRRLGEVAGLPARSRPPVLGESGACTCFAALEGTGSRVFGRGFDWRNRASLLLFTAPPDGYASVSMVDLTILGLRDLSQDASGGVVLSAADRSTLLDAPFCPIDGMNERGLAVGMMAVPDAQPSADPQKATVDSLLVMRLLLDRAGSVDEALSLLASYNLSFAGGPPLHYMVADGSGHSAVVEFVGGEMRTLPNGEPWQVSTNFIISEEAPTGANSTCWRYNKAYETLAQARGRLSGGAAMDLLQAVSQENTMWSVVYDMSAGDVLVAVGRRYDRVHAFRLNTGNAPAAGLSPWHFVSACAAR